MTIVQQCIVNEEVGSATNALWARVWQPPICLKDGTPEQIEKSLLPACRGEIATSFCTSEPTAGSDAGGIRTSATLDGNHYLVNGEKCFASSAEYADVNLLTTVVDGDATVKYYFHEGDRIRLEPANATMEPIFVRADQQALIQGVVVGVFRVY